MAQINFHTNTQFDADLAAVMAALRVKSKSEAIRWSVQKVAAAFGPQPARPKDEARAG